MPNFSVIVPTHNRAHLLPRCLNSVLRQTYTDFEVIVADDGSTDETASVMRKIGSEEPRLRYLYQPNKGASSARNLGASAASGGFLVFLDSDDEVLPEWLQRFADLISSQGADVICCACAEMNLAGAVRKLRLPTEPGPANRYQYGNFYTGTFAIRREIFFKIGGYAPGLPANQHSELRLRLLPLCLTNGWSVLSIQDALVRRHTHTGPSIRKNMHAVYEGGLYVMNHHGHLLRENPRSYSDWAATLGVCAARLGNYRDARRWFWKALVAQPRNLRNYARACLACSPGLRSIVWQR